MTDRLLFCSIVRKGRGKEARMPVRMHYICYSLDIKATRQKPLGISASEPMACLTLYCLRSLTQISLNAH
jgi:hypothetical protein